MELSLDRFGLWWLYAGYLLTTESRHRRVRVSGEKEKRHNEY